MPISEETPHASGLADETAHYDSMRIDAALVRRLVIDQFPHWVDLEVEPVEFDGHDNKTFHLGDEMCTRMPSAQHYAAHVRVEHDWLPILGPHLPLPVPVPLGKGVPGLGYPWPWSVNRWIHGEAAAMDRIADQCRFARDLAHFLNALQSIDTTGAPAPGVHNFFRGGELSVYDLETRECIRTLEDKIDARRATSVWDSALQAKCDRPSVWIHGDVAPGNLLVDDGRLCAVIDFGQLAAGDPSCDVTIAWTLLSGLGREAFRSELVVDDATWVRGRGWGLWKALVQLRAHESDNPLEAAKAQQVIHDILLE